MSQMVSVRIPRDVYLRGIKKLKSIDSNVTELVRSAFDYIISTEKLPGETRSKIEPRIRSLTKDQKLEFADMFYGNANSFDLSDDFDYKNELSRNLKNDYEAISWY